MKYREFVSKVKNFPIISSSLLPYFGDNEQVLRNQLSVWKKRGFILELKRGLYVLNEDDRKITPSRVFLANQLYSPSYISNEYALMFYDLIPERVVDVTSITTKKTTSFENAFGLYIYQHLSNHTFTGYLEKKDENNYSFFIATAEKAVVDFVYFNLPRFKRADTDIFEQSFRFQNYSDLSISKLQEFTLLFANKKLLDIVKLFCRLIEGRS